MIQNDSSRAPAARFTQRRAISISAGYAAVAGLWILLSDMALDSITGSGYRLALLGAIKGWIFVTVTSITLYVLLRRLEPAERTSLALPAPEDGVLRWLVRAAIVLGIVALSAMLAWSNVRMEWRDQEAQLRAIADLKAQQVHDWLQERLADAHQVESTEALGRSLGNWLHDRNTADFNLLSAQLEHIASSGQFSGYELLDAAGARLWGRGLASHDMDPQQLARLLHAADTAGAGWLPPFEDGAGLIHLDFFARVQVERTGAPAIVVLHADDTGRLPASLNDWPLASSSGEIVLFRRENGAIVYLNPLRRAANESLVRRPVHGDTGLLAQQWLVHPEPTGRLLHGRNYLGVPVAGVGRPVKDTDWVLLATVDRQEILDAALDKSQWIVLSGVFALMMFIGVFLLSRQYRRLDAVVAIKDEQTEQLRALNLLASVAEASSDAIFAKGTDGRYLLINRAACLVAGKSAMEVIGGDDYALWSAGEAASIIENDRRVLRENLVMTYEEVVSTPDGKRTLYTTKGPLLDADGKVVGLYGISRDITERRQEDDELRRQKDELERFNRAMVGRELDMITLKQQVNELAAELGRTPPYPAAYADAIVPGGVP